MAHKASSEHLELAHVVRSVHKDLRKLYTGNGGIRTSEEDLWREHCQKEDVLGRYAEAMHRLASVHWTENNASTRIEWCYLCIKDYFHNGGFRRELLRCSRLHNEPDQERHAELIGSAAKIRLLDVGSCYNPFGVYDDLDVIGIDLHPATKDVRRCDFLNLDITEDDGTMVDWNSAPEPVVSCLPAKYFHAIVFSLLLEYLPSVRQRLRCFANASELLSERGLLLVVTPDSKHQSRNAAMVKSWKLGLETLGFRRMRYEKQTHLHCMAFLKARRWTPQPDEIANHQLAEMFYIPQDSQAFGGEEESSYVGVEAPIRTADEDDLLAERFSELPAIHHD